MVSKKPLLTIFKDNENKSNFLFSLKNNYNFFFLEFIKQTEINFSTFDFLTNSNNGLL